MKTLTLFIAFCLPAMLFGAEPIVTHTGAATSVLVDKDGRPDKADRDHSKRDRGDKADKGRKERGEKAERDGKRPDRKGKRPEGKGKRPEGKKDGGKGKGHKPHHKPHPMPCVTPCVTPCVAPVVYCQPVQVVCEPVRRTPVRTVLTHSVDVTKKVVGGVACRTKAVLSALRPCNRCK